MDDYLNYSLENIFKTYPIGKHDLTNFLSRIINIKETKGVSGWKEVEMVRNDMYNFFTSFKLNDFMKEEIDTFISILIQPYANVTEDDKNELLDSIDYIQSLLKPKCPSLLTTTLNVKDYNGYLKVEEILDYNGCQHDDCDICEFIIHSLLDDLCIEGIEIGIHSYTINFMKQDNGNGSQIYLELKE